MPANADDIIIIGADDSAMAPLLSLTGKAGGLFCFAGGDVPRQNQSEASSSSASM